MKLVIFKISVPSADGLKNFNFRKELKLFATSYNYLQNKKLRPPRRKKEIQSLDFLATLLLRGVSF
jgi:hypothetical protein